MRTMGEKLILSLFLDFIFQQALANPEEVVEYTEAMAAEDEELMAGVALDAEAWKV
jgi:antitoxin PrlF